MISRLKFVVLRRWPILLVIPLVGAALGWVFAPRGSAASATRYRADATVAVSQDLNQTAVNQQLIEVRFNEVAESTAEAVGDGATVTSVARTIGSKFDNESYTITFSATADDAGTADAYLEAFTTSFMRHVVGDSAEDRADGIAAAEDAAEQARNERDLFVLANREAIDAPDTPETLRLELEDLQAEVERAEQALASLIMEPESEDPYRLLSREPAKLHSNSKLELPADTAVRVVIGLLLGIAAAVAVTAVIERFNPRIDDPDQATELIGAPVLAMVPQVRRRGRGDIVRMDPDRFIGPFAEAYRAVRTHLDFRAEAEGREDPPTIMVTSATPGEGKSTTTAALAMAYAEADASPLLIAADLRRPTLHRAFEIERVPGLSSRATTGGSAVPLTEIVKRDPVTGVSIVPSGPAVDRVTGLVRDIETIGRTANRSGRVVVVDTPPVLVANDATDFLHAVDWVVLVVRIGRSTRRSVRQVVQTLELNRAVIAGVVVIGSLEAADAARYYSRYYELEGDASRVRPVVDVDADDRLTASGSLEDG